MKTLLKRRTGLIGPAIVKQLVEAHGGRISAVSDGVGKRSTLRSPCRLPESIFTESSPFPQGNLIRSD